MQNNISFSFKLYFYSQKIYSKTEKITFYKTENILKKSHTNDSDDKKWKFNQFWQFKNTVVTLCHYIITLLLHCYYIVITLLVTILLCENQNWRKKRKNGKTI